MLTNEDTLPRRGQGTTRSRKRRPRTLMSYVPVTAVALGITLVISSVVFFYVEDDLRRLVSVTFGLGILIASTWFAANPFLRNARRSVPLRQEVDQFIDLVRLLNRQAGEAGAPEDVEGTRNSMHEAVQRMVAEAEKVG